MKRIICIMAAIILLLAALTLGGCKKDDANETTTAALTSATEPESLPVGTFSSAETSAPTTAAATTAVKAVTTTVKAVTTTVKAVTTTVKAVTTTIKAVTTTKAPVVTTTNAPETTTAAPTTTQVVHNGILSRFSETDINGNTVNQSVLKGKKLTMVNVWATTCGYCIEEMPALAEINDEYASKGFQIIGVVADATTRNGKSDAKDIIEQTGADYIHLVPSETLENDLLKSVTGYPTTFFVNEYGEQVGSVAVGARSKESWIKIIDELLAKA